MDGGRDISNGIGWGTRTRTRSWSWSSGHRSHCCGLRPDLLAPTPVDAIRFHPSRWPVGPLAAVTNQQWRGPTLNAIYNTFFPAFTPAGLQCSEDCQTTWLEGKLTSSPPTNDNFIMMTTTWSLQLSPAQRGWARLLSAAVISINTRRLDKEEDPWTKDAKAKAKPNANANADGPRKSHQKRSASERKMQQEWFMGMMFQRRKRLSLHGNRRLRECPFIK